MGAIQSEQFNQILRDWDFYGYFFNNLEKLPSPPIYEASEYAFYLGAHAALRALHSSGVQFQPVQALSDRLELLRRDLEQYLYQTGHSTTRFDKRV